MIALFLVLIIGAIISIPKNFVDSVESTLPPTPDNRLLEPYKDYIIAYTTAGAPNIAEQINAENAIRNCNTVQEVETCSYVTPLFSSEMILPYEVWTVVGMPSPDDVTLIVTTPSNIRSGPSTDYSIIDTAETGEILIKIEKINEWYRVLFNGQIGYIFGELVIPV